MIRTLNSCNCDDLVTIIDDAIVMEGQKGESAYETAVRLGYQGTEPNGSTHCTAKASRSATATPPASSRPVRGTAI